jgi:O-acetyl-ADP-ribose deacetylase (regulator of RNase III)
MKQQERRQALFKALLAEQPRYAHLPIPQEEQEQRTLLRGLFNIRMPRPTDEAFLDVQDAYLQEETARKGIVSLDDLTPIQPGIYLWQGDITTLACDAIVNAANSQMLGCFVPGHSCIDNQIHTFAGVQLRQACAELMRSQGHEEPTGCAKITPAYNLPCRYVLHTVGPIIEDEVTPEDEALLESCYRSCLELARQNGLTSVAFCCISTGVFRFPNRRAAEIAVQTVQSYLAQCDGQMEVIFNVFKDTDLAIYRSLLG